MDCSTPGFPIHYQLPELTNTHPLSWWYHPTISSSFVPFSSCFQSFPASESFLMSQFFASGGQNIWASASTSVLPMDIQGWFSLGLTDLIFCSPRDSQDSSPIPQFSSVQFISVAQSCPNLCDPMNRSAPGLPVHHQLPEFTQTLHRVSDAIQPSHPLSSPSPPAPNPSQHQSLFQWVNSSHEVAKVLEFQLQHQSFQWTPRTDLL